jgi:ribosomal protein L17
MAERGAPLGNKNGVKNKPWREAIDRALAQGDGKKLRSIADKLIDLAAEGDMAAIRELGDRLDGKPAQAITGADGGPLLISDVTRTIVDPGAKAEK